MSWWPRTATTLGCGRFRLPMTRSDLCQRYQEYSPNGGLPFRFIYPSGSSAAAVLGCVPATRNFGIGWRDAITGAARGPAGTRRREPSP